MTLNFKKNLEKNKFIIIEMKNLIQITLIYLIILLKIKYKINLKISLILNNNPNSIFNLFLNYNLILMK
jgi:hypothetical protein